MPLDVKHDDALGRAGRNKEGSCNYVRPDISVYDARRQWMITPSSLEGQSPSVGRMILSCRLFIEDSPFLPHSLFHAAFHLPPRPSPLSSTPLGVCRPPCCMPSSTQISRVSFPSPILHRPPLSLELALMDRIRPCKMNRIYSLLASRCLDVEYCLSVS